MVLIFFMYTISQLNLIRLNGWLPYLINKISSRFTSHRAILLSINKDSEIMFWTLVFQIYGGLAKWLFPGFYGAIYESDIYELLDGFFL